MNQAQPTKNVTRLNNQSVYSHIRSFLRNKGLKSENTSREYETDIRQFFTYMLNKDIEEVQPSDLRFVNADLLDYQTYLTEEYRTSIGEGYKNNTVNRKLATIASLYQFLKRNDYDVNPEAMTVDDLPDDTSSYGILELSEAEEMAELALTEREKGKEKRLLILLALRTSMRKEALLSLEWSDIKPNSDNDNYLISVTDSERFDKTKKIEKEISSYMYNELLTIKIEDRNKIFNLDGKYVNAMIRRLTDKMGIPRERKIVFHSLKKTGINFVYEVTNGDIYAASSQAGHSSISTTAKSYMSKQKNLAGTLMDSNISTNIFKQLTHEECIQLLGSIGNGLGHHLRTKAHEIIDKRI